MLNTVWEDVKRQYFSGNMITRLILVNLGFFLFFRLLWLGMFLVQGQAAQNNIFDFLYWFSISSDWFKVITRPWTLLTNMFLHFEVGHFLWNMLYLYWFGRILSELVGNYRILGIYVMSGLAGALAYFAFANIFNLPIGEYALGASAAIMGLILAAATTAPNYQIHLMFIGGVKLMYIALFVVVLDLISIPTMANTGGHVAHLGGAMMGFFIARQIQNGTDWTEWFNNIVDKIVGWFEPVFTHRPKPKMAYKNPNKPTQKPKNDGFTSQDRQAKIDAILDKIKKEGGYNNLTAEEKEFLFRASKEE
ncbi:MAG: rhomboid family intramembrane serine protease [Saprospiraceae bacterium]|nr:rhomboid family intramembrane serine protease [Saprospiraceae bacterium]